MSYKFEFTKEIKVDSSIRFKQIVELNEGSSCRIPSNVIIHKSVPGIGATYEEITAPRSSIVVLPHVNVILSKHENHGESDSTFPVYGKISGKQIAAYIKEREGQRMKFLATPNGFIRIIDILKDYGIDPYRNFFVLLDECHKWITDVDFREDMIKPMDEFFQFDGKAMVSATPIPPSDPRLEKFERIKITQKTPIKLPVELRHVRSTTTALKDYVGSNNQTHYCIFFNSIDGIRAIISELDIQQDSRIFCSSKAVDDLQLLGYGDVSSSFTSLAKYSFFTSSFFNGLDIHLTTEYPDIIILTDLSFAEHSLLHPATDVLQIIGRFRKRIVDNQSIATYRNIIHLNNIIKRPENLSHEKAVIRLYDSQRLYEGTKSLLSTATDAHVINIMNDACNKQPYSEIINDNGQLCHFKKDNYLYKTNTSSLYSTPSALLRAYNDADMFKISRYNIEPFTNRLNYLKRLAGKYSKTWNKSVAELLHELEPFAGGPEYMDAHFLLMKWFPNFVKAYDRLGYDEVAKASFSMTAIKKALIKLSIMEGRNHFPLIEAVCAEFRNNQAYTRDEIKNKLQSIYDYYDHPAKAKGEDICNYFYVEPYNKRINGKSTNAFILRKARYVIDPVLSKR